MFFNVLLKSRNKPSNDIKPRIKEQTQNKKKHEHQRTWTSNLQGKKKEKHEHHQIKEHEQEQTQENPHETTPKPNHPKNRNLAKHPIHPLPNQTIIKEILNTTTS